MISIRLWHIDLIPYLPKSQLLAQWRELNSIYKKQDKHILINYIYDYDKKFLWIYSLKVINELIDRKCNIKQFEHYDKYFEEVTHALVSSRFAEHNDEYLTICYYNLKEKYLRGQKDFTDDVWQKLDDYYKRRNKK